MSDDVKGFRERITAAMERITAGHSPMRIPADMTDPDIVLSDCLARIDGEQARQDASVAAAREEQREACALWMQGPDPTMMDVANGETVRGTPLTSTPLADRIAELSRTLQARVEDWNNERTTVVMERRRANDLEAERDRARERLALQVGIAVKTPLPLLELVVHVERLLMDTRAERDALRAQVSELEEYKQEGDDVEVAAQRLRFWAENPYACPVHFGARTACGQCYDSERALRRSTEAQVEAARAMAKSEARPRAGGASVTSEAARDMRRRLAKDILAAMDGAKPK